MSKRIKSILRSILKSIFKEMRMDGIVSRESYSASKQVYMENRALTSHESLVSGTSKDSISTVVSLTTYSSRIHKVHLTIESLGIQTLKADKIILWLDKNEFSQDTIPISLKRQEDRGLTIKFCNNLKSYKKLVPNGSDLKKYTFITVDDDIIYPSDLIESLWKDHEINRDCVIAHRVHKVKFINGQVEPYNSWQHGVYCDTPSFDLCPIGVGGVLYPPGSLNDDVLNMDLAFELAPSADDLWFKVMAVLNGTKCVSSSRHYNFNDDFIYINGSQEISLTRDNVCNNGNDAQMKNIINHFGNVFVE